MHVENEKVGQPEISWANRGWETAEKSRVEVTSQRYQGEQGFRGHQVKSDDMQLLSCNAVKDKKNGAPCKDPLLIL